MKKPICVGRREVFGSVISCPRDGTREFNGAFYCMRCDPVHRSVRLEQFARKRRLEAAAPAMLVALKAVASRPGFVSQHDEQLKEMVNAAIEMAEDKWS